jgi:hypothetical protein
MINNTEKIDLIIAHLSDLKLKIDSFDRRMGRLERGLAGSKAVLAVYSAIIAALVAAAVSNVF